MTDIVDRAKELLDGITPGPWEVIHIKGLFGIAAAEEALATIRALHTPSSHLVSEDRHCVECGWFADWPYETARRAYREDEL